MDADRSAERHMMAFNGIICPRIKSSGFFFCERSNELHDLNICRGIDCLVARPSTSEEGLCFVELLREINFILKRKMQGNILRCNSQRK
jgi:hypothetical protein